MQVEPVTCVTQTYWVCAANNAVKPTDIIASYPDPEKELVSPEFHGLIRRFMRRSPRRFPNLQRKRWSLQSQQPGY
jgi:hypothetical protein